MKKFNSILTIAALMILSVSVIYALFGHVTESKENKFTPVSESTELIEAVYEMKGSTLHKEPFVINKSSKPCLVRLKIIIDPEEIMATNVVTQPSEDEIEKLIEMGYKFWISFQETWKYNENDGYWYYKGILEPSDTTPPVFKTVNWLNKDEDGNWLDYQDFDIYIYKESVFSEAYDSDGVKYTATDSNGNYNYEKALNVWEISNN